MNYCFTATTENHFCTRLWLVTNNGFIIKIKRKETHGCPPAKLALQNRGQFASAKSMLFVRTRSFVYSKLLNPVKTLNAQCYRQQLHNLTHALIKNRAEWSRRNGKMILLHDNAWSHVSKLLKNLEIAFMGHPQTPAILPSPGTILLLSFALMSHALAEKHCTNFREVGKWLNDWFSVKGKHFF